MEIRVHRPGQLDFQIVTKDVSVTEFRRKPSAVWDYLKTPGHVIFFTRRGKRDCAIMSIETHVSYKDLKVLMADLKAVYAAVDEPSALIALDAFEATWGKKHPRIAASWRENWANLSTYFKFPQEIRQLIYTTNTIEGFNRQLRKVTKAKAVFPRMTVCRRCCIWLWWTSRRNGPGDGRTGASSTLNWRSITPTGCRGNRNFLPVKGK